MARPLPTPVWVRTGSGLNPRWQPATLVRWERIGGRWRGITEDGRGYDEADLAPRDPEP